MERELIFWGDTWCGSTPLKDKYPLLYNLCNEIEITVAEAARINWFFTYRRWLSVELLVQDGEMRDRLSRITLSHENDSPIWDWTSVLYFVLEKNIVTSRDSQILKKKFKNFN
jgi:hypothetical protein